MNNVEHKEKSYESQAYQLIEFANNNDFKGIISCIDKYIEKKDWCMYSGFTFENQFMVDNPFTQMFLQIFENVNIELLGKILEHENTDKLLICHGNRISEYILNCIFNNTKTDIICTLIKKLSCINVISSRYLFAAVEANNIPVFTAIISYAPYFELCYSRIIKELIDPARYEWLDLLVENCETFLSDVITDIIIKDKTADVICKRLTILCSRYLPTYIDYSDKEQAITDFIKSNLEIDKLADSITENMAMSPFMVLEDNASEQLSNYLSFLKRLGTKISSDNIMSAFYWIYNVLGDSCSSEYISELLSLIVPDTCVMDLEASTHFNCLFDDFYKSLALLVKQYNIRLYVDINDLNPCTHLKLNNLKKLSKIATLRIVGPVQENQAIKELIDRNDLPVFNLLLKSNTFNQDDIKYLVKYCTSNHKSKLLDIIKEYHK